MLALKLWQASFWHCQSTCLSCAIRGQLQSRGLLWWRAASSASRRPARLLSLSNAKLHPNTKSRRRARKRARKLAARKAEGLLIRKFNGQGDAEKTKPSLQANLNLNQDEHSIPDLVGREEEGKMRSRRRKGQQKEKDTCQTLKEAMLGTTSGWKLVKEKCREKLDISILQPKALTFHPIHVPIPPVPMLSYGLDRVLFNPGVYLLQDPRSRVYNFDPYLEKIMPVNEFDFDALSEYKTSSQDEALLDLTRQVGTRFTGSTSSMSSLLQHFHYLLSNFRPLNHNMLSREYPAPSSKFSKITLAPSAVFLRLKDGIYAIDADKSYDTPNIMSWLGHSLEKLLTSDRAEFERYRRSSSEKAPIECKSDRCYHYSKQGNILMRSQLDALDPRLPGTGVFDLKTRAVVSIRMDHEMYEVGSGYQLRKARGEWESFEREFYDMTRATLLKYSLQVRMGRMDGIFISFHNIERIFGFQYLSLSDMDAVLHGQHDTSLGDEEFKLSIALLDELLGLAIQKFPNTSLRIHVETRDLTKKFMYIFVEPVTEDQADEIQTRGEASQKKFARAVVGVGKDNPEVQAAWQDLQDEVDEQVDQDESSEPKAKSRIEEAQNGMIAEAEKESVQSGQKTNSVQQKPGCNVMDSEVVADVQDGMEDGVDQDLAVKNLHDSEDINGMGPASGMAEHSGDAERNLERVDIASANGNMLDVSARDSASSADLTESSISATSDDPSAPELESRGPLFGWTLTIRNKINGEYMDRPENYTQQDNWELEYHIQDIPEHTRWKLYDGLVHRRRQRVSRDEEVDKSLKRYRDFIHGYSHRGREWRAEQDRMDKAKPVQLFRPLGPGSNAQNSQFGDGKA